MNKDTQFDEFKEPVPLTGEDFKQWDSMNVSRSTFLKLMGMTFAAAAAGCSPMPVKKAIPYVNKPKEITPGVNAWYASTCGGCSARCGLLVKSRDGRPIKIEGNPEHPLSQGGVCALGQGTLLNLYDVNRAQFPTMGQKKSSWKQLDEAVIAGLQKARNIRILTPSLPSPFSQDVVDQFVAHYSSARQVRYDREPLQGLLLAHERSFGRAVLPSFYLDKAKVIVGVDADFLASWIAPVAFTKAYAKRRKVSEQNADMSLHVQVEGRLSLTGSNADLRLRATPAEQVDFLLWLAREIGLKRSGGSALTIRTEAPKLDPKTLERTLTALLAHPGESLLLCGSNDPDIQCLVAYINSLLGNYGRTLSVASAAYQCVSTGSAWNELVEDMEKGRVDALILYGVNPVYDSAEGARFAKALEKVALRVSLAERADESTVLCQYHAPDHHYLESWNDARPQSGVYSLFQPLVRPLFDTRQAQESLLAWAGKPQKAYDSLRAFWQQNIYSQSSRLQSFNTFWRQVVQLGVFTVAAEASEPASSVSSVVASAATALARRSPEKGLTLALYEKVAIRGGQWANNPWLQELPDPVSKVTWDNYASLSVGAAKALGLELGDLLTISTAGQKLTLPVYIQPGQHDSVVAVALGYGRTHAGNIGNGVGQNATPLSASLEGRPQWTGLPVKIARASGKYKLALTQEHNFLEGRPIVQETTLTEYQKDPGAGVLPEHKLPSLWPEFPYPGHRWAMAVDLNSCTGCGACVVACQSENNIPSVGKKEVATNREMHWIRIDRYYSKDEENPTVTHQPMMCQHCGNAPCETVCPVLATVHSTEGLNQQVYNRCVGTRYCANNCPYKVRRFNWFNYSHDDLLANLALNPDVTVRSRGVMEKCSFCVQRIEEKRFGAKREGRDIKDGEIKTACQQSCPANALVFGDMNDPESEVSKLMKSGRAYHVLHDVGTKPSVTYLAKVRNIEPGPVAASEEAHHG